VNGKRRLAKLIETGKAKPSFLVSHELPLEDALDAYEHFDDCEYGWTKVVLKPAAAAAKKTGKAEAS
jgi:glutathione-independent formaldehyde dehydrogenase